MHRKHIFPVTLVVSILSTVLLGSFGYSFALNKDNQASLVDLQNTQVSQVQKVSSGLKASPIDKKYFVPNQGQVSGTDGKQASSVLYVWEDQNTKIYFQKDKVSYVYQHLPETTQSMNKEIAPSQDLLKAPVSDVQKEEEQAQKDMSPTQGDTLPKIVDQYRFDMVFQSSNRNVVVECAQYGTVLYNFYYPNVRAENVRVCERIVYRNIYPSIDLQYYSDGHGHLKYDFIVHPKANPKQIAWRYDGASSVDNTPKGLLINTPLGSLTENLPISFQTIRGSKKNISSTYSFDPKKKVVGITVGKFDVSQDLIIDPLLEWSTYFGGSEWEWGEGIESNSTGSVISGHTASGNLPVTNGSTQSSLNVDVFVAKFNSSGGLLMATYIGGDSEDRALDVVLDANKIFITGFTASQNFPITLGGVNGVGDMFICHLNGSGNLVWSKRFGGSNGGTSGNTIAKMGNGDLIVTGGTTASNLLLFPSNNFSLNAGTQDGFVMRVDQNATVIWDTFLGGTGDDYLNAITPDSQGNVVVVGDTTSTDLNLTLGVPSVLQNTYGGYLSDAYLVRLDANGVLQWWSYMGGWSYDYGYGVTVDQDDNIIADGLTWSSNFPVSLNASQPIYGGFGDAWIAKITPGGVVVWNTYVGGSNSDVFYRPTLDHSFDIVVSGTTSSSNYPGATNTFYSGSQDVSLTKLTPNGQLLSSQYLGSASGDFVFDIAVSDTSLYATGLGPVGIPNPLNLYAGGPNDALLAKWDNCTSRAVNPTSPDGTVNRAYVDSSGNNMYIGGYFKNVAGIVANGIAKWDGNTFSALANGFPVNDVNVRDITEFNGELYAGGVFNVSATLKGIAKWDAGNQIWQSVGTGIDGDVHALAVYNGELYAGGEFYNAGGVVVKGIAKWNGLNWSAVDLGVSAGNMNEKIYTLKEFNSELYVGGEFDTVGSSFMLARNIAKWNGLNWSPVGSGVDGAVKDLENYNGALVIGGFFLVSGTNTLNYIAKWDGVSILPFNVQGADQPVSSLYTHSGVLYVGGSFDQIDGIDVAGSAQWNGSAWKHMSLDILNGPILDFAKFQNKEYFFGEYQSTCAGSPMFMTEYNP